MLYVPSEARVLIRFFQTGREEGIDRITYLFSRIFTLTGGPFVFNKAGFSTSSRRSVVNTKRGKRVYS